MMYRSPAINLEDIGSVHFRLHASEGTQNMRLMRADVKIEGPTIFIFIDEATEGWPFTIENDTDHTFTLTQTVCEHCGITLNLHQPFSRISTARKEGRLRSLARLTQSPPGPVSTMRGTVQLLGTSASSSQSVAPAEKSTSWRSATWFRSSLP